MVGLTHLENKPYINHKNGDKADPRVSNLEWCTASENTQHAYDTGLKKRGEDFCCAKLTDSDVEEIKLRFVNGDRDAAILKDYAISAASISQIRKGRSWRHIRPDLVWETKARKSSSRKLCAEDIPAIRYLIARGVGDTAIAKEYGVNRGTIFQIRIGKNWTNY
jgi:hypothetical protein